MLAPDLRMLLTTSLQPPPGMRLEHAVATTFTLDLEALLLVPLSIAGFSVDEQPDPIQMLEALRSLGDRLDVFCQAGMISADRHPSDLVALLEDSVHEVNRPRRGKQPFLFHPKVWALHYTDETDDAYRLLVLTRNLTHDTSWDLLVRLDGTPTTTVQKPNQQITKLLSALPGLCRHPLPFDREQRVAAMADRLRRVHWEVPEPAKRVEFFAVGLDSRRDVALDDMFRGNRQLIISPFVTDDGLNQITEHCTTDDITVVSRPDDLARLDPDTLDGITAYVLDPAAQLDTTTPDFNDEGPKAGAVRPQGFLGNLHAKAYITEYGRQSWVLVGSANATGPGFGGNVEFLVALIGGRTKMGIDTFLDQDPDETNLFTLLEPYEPPNEPTDDDPDEITWRLDRALIELAETPLTTTVTPTDGTWIPTVTSEAPLIVDDQIDVTVALANRPDDEAPIGTDEPLSARFDAQPLAEVTPLLRFTARLGNTTRSALVISRLVGAPDDRLDQLLAAQLDSPDKFLRFVLLLLGLAHQGHALPEPGADPTTAAWAPSAAAAAGFLELFITALATRPDAIDRLAEVIDKLDTTDGPNVFPDGWDKVWPVVLEARATLGARIDD